MLQVVVVGAGFYGLIAAKTYLQVTGVYSNTDKGDQSYDDVLIVDSASDIGGTWAQERLYPNLLSQNSYGLYEFSDLPLATAVPHGLNEDSSEQFIPGWKINRYLHTWCQKWGLTKRIRLNWKVVRISRLPSKQWSLDIVAQAGTSSESIVLTCDKLILATGVTSEPNIPDIPTEGNHPITAIHAKDIGKYCRENLGYQPVPCIQDQENQKYQEKSSSVPRSVAIYGGAKSAFDLVHLFGSLHRNSTSLRLGAQPLEPVKVHWIIREDGHGPAWMTKRTTRLGTRQVASDQAVCTRLVGILTRCVYEVPKRIVWRPFLELPRMEGSWMRRLLHGNPLGRLVLRQVWKRADVAIQAAAMYDSQPKMEKLRPAASAIECTSLGGIANHSDLWETIHGTNVHIYRSRIARFSGTSPNPGIELVDGTHIPRVDLVVHATGWKSVIPVAFDPPTLGARLGLPCPLSPAEEYDWETLEKKVESSMRQTFDSSLFTRAELQANMPYRLFRRIASPSLVAEGDRSFVVMGAVFTGTVAIVAEVQALWAAAFLTGGLDRECDGHPPYQGPFSSGSEPLYEATAEDVVWGRLTGIGLDVDTIKYNDTLMRDLGLNPYRMGGWWWNELTALYGPSSYAGIVEEWMKLRDGGEDKSESRTH